jgi:hypothetical protein
MKRITALIICMILFNIFTTFAQWQNLGQYYEISTASKPVSQIITPKDSNFFYVINNDDTLRKYNFDGELLSAKNMKTPDYNFSRCSNDGLTTIHIKVVEHEFYYNSFKCKCDTLYILCKRIADDSIVFNRIFHTFFIGMYTISFNVNGLYCDYNLGLQKGLFGYKYYEQQHGGGNIHQDYSGYFAFYRDSFFIPIVNYSEFIYLNFTNDYSIVFLNTHSKTEISRFDEYDYFTEETTSLIFRDFKSTYSSLGRIYIDTQHPEVNKDWGIIPKTIAIANKEDYLTAIYNNKGFIYHYNDSTWSFMDSCQFDFSPLNLIYSQNDKYLIISNPNKKISIYDLNNKIIIKEYSLIDSINTYALINLDNKGFLACNNKGKVKLFSKDSILSHIEEYNSNAPFTISPNPASDYLLLPEEFVSNTEISIYSVLGLQVLQIIPEGNRIDVSGLSPGVYFVRYKDKVQKFIKI